MGPTNPTSMLTNDAAEQTDEELAPTDSLAVSSSSSSRFWTSSAVMVSGSRC